MATQDHDPAGGTLETTLDEEGRETASTMLASKGGVDTMYISPNQAIPVIFVPGIMGSPLISVDQSNEFWPTRGKWAWFPDDDGWIVWGFGKIEAWDRKGLLAPEKTRPVQSPRDADEATISEFVEPHRMPLAEAKRRGWGSVMLKSYSGILKYLETQLKYIFYRGNIYPGTERTRPAHPEDWGELKGYARLSDEQLRSAAAWRFPVYAVGYNWMDSNGNAADYLKRRIDAIRADCRERLKLKVDKVILVTYSMGGLVGRMCAKRYEDDILGIVHGVQPATGAATAYARVRGGWESNASLRRPLGVVPAMVGAWALGWTGRKVATVFAAGPGPLELLPNQLYGSGWMNVTFKGNGRSEEKPLFSLPLTNPYDEIYRVSDKWWRLVHPGSLVKGKDSYSPSDDTSTEARAEWAIYSMRLDIASSFHTELATYYHPQTYAYCGADDNRQAWHRVSWKLTDAGANMPVPAAREPTTQEARDGVLESDPMSGYCYVRNPASARKETYYHPVSGVALGDVTHVDTLLASLSGQDDAGDATVPAHSGLAPHDDATFFAAMRGFEHQGSYDDDAVRAVTLYSIIRMAAQAEPLE